MQQTPIPEGFSSLRPTLGVGHRKGLIVKRGGADDLLIATFVPLEPRSTEARLIWQAFENASQLIHPGIIPPIDVKEVPGGLVILTPHIDGPSVRSIIDARLQSGRTLDLPTILRIARPLCAALHYGHDEAGDVDDELLHIPHGWICPETVRLTSAGEVKFLDYWMGWVVARLARHVPTAYTSPQIARGEPPSSQGDIFAMGALLFELATLSPIITETSRASIHEALRDALYRRRFELLGHRDPGLGAIIRRCLSPVGAHRYPDIRALDADLLRLSRGEAPLALDLAQGHPGALPPALQGEPDTLAPKGSPAPEALPPKETDPALRETDLLKTTPSPLGRPPLDTQDLIETSLVAPEGLAAANAPLEARPGEKEYGLRETQEMPPEMAAAIAKEIQDEAQGLSSKESVKSGSEEGVVDWFKGRGTGAEIVEAFNSPSPFDEAAAQHRAQAQDTTPFEEGEEFDDEVDLSARPPRLRRLLTLVAIAAMVIFGARYVLQTFSAHGDFRIERMEQLVGLNGSGSEEERLIVLEALAGRQRIGDNLAFRAEHLESELGPLILAAQGSLAPIEAYYGLGEEPDPLPIHLRLSRLEVLTFGEPRFRPAPEERPYSLKARRDHLVEANRGRIALVGTRILCEGGGACEEGSWGESLNDTIDILNSKTKAQWADETKSAIPRVKIPPSVEGRLLGAAGEISAGDR